MDKTLYLVLENGKVFQGYSIGAQGEVIGETVFQTSVLGYNEAITDPKYCGQIVVQTFPQIGNYGIITEELDTKEPVIGGYIVKSVCDTPSNFRTAGKLDDYLKKKGIVGLAGIDTRELTRIIRDNGTMNGKITSDISNIDNIKNELKSHNNSVDLGKVSINAPKLCEAENADFKVVMYDFGASKGFVECFTSMGIAVECIPYDTKADDIGNADGIILSEGPGNPSDYSDIVNEIKKLTDRNIPVYGCGLGHQLLAIALGAKTKKHAYGHRGSNQPVKNTESGKIYITTQNHGYIVDETSLPNNAEISFINVNDKTIEGLSYPDKKAFSTQFMPNICNGPHDTRFIIANFKNIMKGDK